MKMYLMLAAVLMPTLTFAQAAPDLSEAGAIYDPAGKKVFSLVETGETEEVVGIDGPRVHRLYDLMDLETGAVYSFSPKRDQVVSAGGIFMDYHFNQRRWYWVEGLPVKTSPLMGEHVDRDSARRSYSVSREGMTTPEQDEHPILRLREGSYLDEMGRPIYLKEGSFPAWCEVILLHKYYEQVYTTAAFDELKAYRDAEVVRLADSNTLALELLAAGDHNEANVTTAFGKRHTMIYVADIGGRLVRLSRDQVKRLKNEWLVAKEEEERAEWGLVIPRAGFNLSKKAAGQRGFADVGSTDVVLELRPSPERLAEFQAAIAGPAASGGTLWLAEAAKQARVDELSVGILAGSLKPGVGNGYRTDATFAGPQDVAVDSAGNLFVVDGDVIRKITPDGQVHTLAGGTRGHVDGQGITARFSSPLGIATGPDGSLYVADSGNRRIRKITPDGYVGTLAGGASGYRDGFGPNAEFEYPAGIAVDAQGNVFVGDLESKKIRKVSADGNVTTVGDEAEVRFLKPGSLAVDRDGYAYVLDIATIKRIAPDGSVSMMAPDMTFDAAADGMNRALFRDAGGIEIDKDGNLLVTTMDDHAVIRIAPGGEVTTLATNSPEFWLGRPNAVAVGADGNVFLADAHNKVVHQVTPAGNTGPLPGMRIPEPQTEMPAAPPADAAALSPEEAKALLASTKRNAKKDPQAMFELANLYAAGVGGRPDPVRALSSFKKAARSGHPGAQYELALRHLNGEVPYSLTVVNGDVEAGMAKQMAKRQVNAAELFRQSADQGYALAQYALAGAYLNGEGVEQSTATAIDWLSRAGAQGMHEAQFELAQMYHKGNGVPVDLAKAIEWYGMAAEQGDAYSATIANGLFVQTDPDGVGRQINTEASEKAELAMSYYHGAGVEQDLTQAMSLLEESALLGNTSAQFKLGVMYLNGEGADRDLELGMDWLTLASELDHAEAQFYLGFVHDSGHAVERNAELAHYWYSRAAEQGLAGAQFALGNIYYRGDGRKADPAIAREWFELAAAQGDAEAQYLAATLYLDDTGGETDAVRANALFRSAAAQGHVYAAAQLQE